MRYFWTAPRMCGIEVNLLLVALYKSKHAFQ